LVGGRNALRPYSIMPSNSQLPTPITLLINTHSRRGKEHFDAAQEALARAGLSVEAHALESKDETIRLLKREIEAGAGLVIVGGGDGTLSECASHLVGTKVAMGVLPLGTGNTLARSLGLPLDLEGAAKAIAAGHVENIDVGRVNGRVFLNSVTLGLSTEIAQALDGPTKKKLGLLAWPIIGGKIIARHRALHLKVTSQERTFRVRTHQLIVANGRYVAGPVAASPEASIQNAVFDVFVLGGAQKRSLARAAWRWLRGTHVGNPEERYFQTDNLSVESLHRQLDADVDGEIVETTPLEISLDAKALRIVVPRGFEAESV